MIVNQEPIEDFQDLYAEIKRYIQLQTEYIKVDFVEKLSIILSTILIVSVIILLFTSTLLFAFFALAYWLVSYVGSMALSFGVITMAYIVLIFVFYALRKHLIINPIVKMLSKLFLTKENH